MFIIDDIINAIGGMATAGVEGAINYKTQKDLMNAQNAWSEKMNAQQQAWQEAMWNKNNLYNSAPEQMKRMMQAGINPNSAANAVAGVNASSQLAAQPSIPSSASGSLSAPLDLGNTLTQFMQAGMQREMNEKQKELIDSQIDETDAKAKLTDYMSQTEQERKEKEKAITEFTKGQNKMVNLQLKEIHQNIKNAKLRNEYQEWVNNVLNPLLEATQTQEYENLKKAYEEADARIRTAGEQIEVLKATKSDLLSSAKLRDKQANLVDKQAEGQDVSNDIAKLDKQIRSLEKQQIDIKTGLVKQYGFDPATTNMGNQGMFLIHRIFSVIGNALKVPSTANHIRNSNKEFGQTPYLKFDSSDYNPLLYGY